jgi:hypothetical protein
MKTDLCTKAVLSVITLALAVIALNALGVVARAEALGYGEDQKVMITNLKPRTNGVGERLHVPCETCG